MTAAADRLGVTQPPVSQAIKKLESHVGTPLIERSSSGVTPTAAGRHLLPQVRVLVRDAAALTAASSRLSAASDSLSVGIVSSMPPGISHGLMERLHDRHTTQVRIGTSDELVEAVDTMGLDVAVLEDPCPTGDLLRGQLHDASRVVAGLATKPPRWSVLSKDPEAVLLDNTRSASPAAADRLEDALFSLGLTLRTEQWRSLTELSARLANPAAIALVPTELSGLWPSVRAPAALSQRLRYVVHPDRSTLDDGSDIRAMVDRHLRSAVQRSTGDLP